MRCKMPFNPRCLSLGLLLVCASSQVVLSQEQATHQTRDQMEQFLLNANVVRRKALGQGVTNSERATLSDGQLNHDAHVQSIDTQSNSFTTKRGTELNF